MFRSWLSDLQALYLNKWDTHFSSEPLGAAEAKRAAFLVFLCMVPATVVFSFAPKMGSVPMPTENPAQHILTSPAPQLPSQVLPMVQYLGTPLQVVITGMLMSLLLHVCARFNRVEKKYPFAFRVMLKVMAIQPILQCFYFFPVAPVIALLVLGFFVARAANGAYEISKRNAYVYFGAIYFMFALMQLKSVA